MCFPRKRRFKHGTRKKAVNYGFSVYLNHYKIDFNENKFEYILQVDK